ncbi:hypothetical protein C8J57DRAFT_1739630 [Mycena rebaudengoi]|nr:hypothetical protein C8J57DRAFT_1739630 [Mycena rebaudengoi]
MNDFVPAPVITDLTVSAPETSVLCVRNSFGEFVPPGLSSHFCFHPLVYLSVQLHSRRTTSGIRSRFLRHGWQYGLSLSTPKWNALCQEDQSGIIVHPTLVNMGQVMGCLLTSHLQHHTWVYHTGQTIAEEEQVSLILGRMYIWQRGEVVEQNEAVLGLGEISLNLNIGLSAMRRISLRTKVEDEGRATFSALMFIDMIRTLVLKLPSVLNAALFSKFTRMARKNRTCTDVVFLRSKSAMFLIESQFMVSAWNKSKLSSSVFPTEWSRGYWDLIEDIHAHLKVINSCWAQVYTIPELRTVYPMFENVPAVTIAKPVNAVVRITSTFSAADYQFLDPALAVCWAIAQRPVGNGDAETDDVGATDGPSDSQPSVY